MFPLKLKAASIKSEIRVAYDGFDSDQPGRKSAKEPEYPMIDDFREGK
jgi:hypothetical protein